MAFTVKDVLRRSSTILQDAGSIRWPIIELIDWINDGLREITLHAPSAVSETAVLDMAAGTLQTLPAEYSSLLRVNCNITGTPGNYVRGDVVTPINRAVLDAQRPGWQVTSKLPFQPTVRHLVEDPNNHREFYVAPGNDGTGKIEVVVAKRPTQVVETADALNIDSYTDTIDLDDIYLGALTDFVLSKAFSKDTNVAGGGQRAVAHYTQFANALGIKAQNEAAINPMTADRSKG